MERSKITGGDSMPVQLRLTLGTGIRLSNNTKRGQSSPIDIPKVERRKIIERGRFNPGKLTCFLQHYVPESLFLPLIGPLVAVGQVFLRLKPKFNGQNVSRTKAQWQALRRLKTSDQQPGANQ